MLSLSKHRVGFFNGLLRGSGPGRGRRLGPRSRMRLSIFSWREKRLRLPPLKKGD